MGESIAKVDAVNARQQMSARTGFTYQMDNNDLRGMQIPECMVDARGFLGPIPRVQMSLSQRTTKRFEKELDSEHYVPLASSKYR